MLKHTQGEARTTASVNELLSETQYIMGRDKKCGIKTSDEQCWKKDAPQMLKRVMDPMSTFTEECTPSRQVLSMFSTCIDIVSLSNENMD